MVKTKMEPGQVEEVLKQAARAVEHLPDALKARGFELAVNMLTGRQTAAHGGSAEPPRIVQQPGTTLMHADTAATTDVEVSDLLPLCKRNPDRYLLFIRDLEGAGEASTTSALVDRFRKYKQDAPKLPSRDLADMVAKGLVEQIGRGRDSTFILKRKGRERLAQLDAAMQA